MVINMKTNIKTNMKTFKAIREADILVGQLYQATPELMETKFGYAWKRFTEKNYIPTLKKLQEEVNDARIDNALEDAITKEVLRDPTSTRGFKYTKEGLKAVIKKENEINDRYELVEIDVEPYIVDKKNLPKLNEEQGLALVGMVI